VKGRASFAPVRRGGQGGERCIASHSKDSCKRALFASLLLKRSSCGERRRRPWISRKAVSTKLDPVGKLFDRDAEVPQDAVLAVRYTGSLPQQPTIPVLVHGISPLKSTYIKLINFE